MKQGWGGRSPRDRAPGRLSIGSIVGLLNINLFEYTLYVYEYKHTNISNVYEYTYLSMEDSPRRPRKEKGKHIYRLIVSKYNYLSIDICLINPFA